ncbi:MAG TPA: potassium channel family protein [Streptomyces sp.]|uniref:potassium channel family protein n=1 Tax=Streptomyces sp. TaxID=1931 RepID=UPI002D61F6EC|nr:potassium channel family protein [Streptomyces sp.]HZG05784.1 potassium channel family protein [Streptomyces sp.]
MREPGPSRRARADRGEQPSRTVRSLSALALLRPALITAALLLAYYRLPLDEEFTGDTVALLVSGLAAALALFVWQVRGIERSPRPLLRAVESLVSVLLLFLLSFAAAYYLLERAEPGSFTEPFTRTDSLYFTLSTFTTAGFGDITPRSQLARVMTMFQMAGGLLFVGVAVRLVADTVQSALRRQASPDRDGRGGGALGE